MASQFHSDDNSRNKQIENNGTESTASGSKKDFKRIVQMLGPAIKVHLEYKKKRNKKGDDLGLDSSSHSSEFWSNSDQPLSNNNQLEEKMDKYHFSQLMTSFSEHVPEQEPEKPKSRMVTRDTLRTSKSERKSGLLTLTEFKDILLKLLGIPKNDTETFKIFDKQAEMLFRKVDRNHTGEVSWDSFCSYIMLKWREKDHSRLFSSSPFSSQPRLIQMHNMKESISKLITDMNPTRFVVISKDGVINILGSNLELVRCFEVENDVNEEKGTTRRRMKLWVTDAVYLPNVNKMVISTTNRDLRFYDMSTPVYKAQFLLCALPHVPMCLDYSYNKKNKAASSLLLFGTDCGDVHLMTFNTPIKGLFETPFKRNDNCWQIFFSDLAQHHRKVSHTCLTRVHSDWVRRVRYLPQTAMLISCSSSGKESLVFRDLDESKRKTYTFRVSKGIDCFDFSKDNNLLVTGGVDHVVRLWDPYVTHKPTGLLKGHQASIADVLIHEKLGQIFSFSKDGGLRAWDIKEQCCLQSLAIKLPVGITSTDHGPCPIFRTQNNKLLISLECYIAEIILGNSQRKTSYRTTHQTPLCGAVYNYHLDQVVTGSEGSELSIWDVESGQLISTMSDVHDHEEMTCLTVDKSCQRLITATRHGSVSVWNLATGIHEKKLLPYDESEITDVVHLADRNLIACVGWTKKILVYDDTKQEGSLPYQETWASFEAHEDDILSIAYCAPNIIATGSFNGEIKIWSLDKERILKRLKRGSDKKRPGISVSTIPPIDKLLFLTTRPQYTGAVLIASTAGWIQFWCLFVPEEPAGSFQAGSGEDSSILAVCSDTSDSYLVTGDTNGFISIWDISTYCLEGRSSIVDQGVSKDKTFVTVINRPKRVRHFGAHLKAIVTVSILERDTRKLILSSSSDCCAKLYNFNGEPIGTFGQKLAWQLSATGSGRAGFLERRKAGTKTETHFDRMNSAPIGSHLGNETVSECSSDERPFTTSSLPNLGCSRSVGTSDSIAKDIQSWTRNEYYRSRTMIVDSISRRNEMWSFLGENYNDNIKRRMNDRRNRRANLSSLENNVGVCKSGGIPCSPFKALTTAETIDPVLPKHLPVTKRMVSRGIDPSHLESLDNLYFLKDKENGHLYPSTKVRNPPSELL